MRRALLVVGMFALVLTAWAAAPALSLSRYAPEPVDFEQELPGVARAAGGLQITPVIRAPARFDLVGLARRTSPVSYRVRSLGGRWSRWVEADNGDPVWAGGADEVQLRSEHGRPAGRLHYVNVSGTATARDRLLTGLRRAVNSAVVSVAPVRVARAQGDGLGSDDGGVQGPGAAPPEPDPGSGEAPGRPPIVSRAEWGADRCRPRAEPAYGEVKAAMVHHTVSANDYSPEEARSLVLGICRYHRNGNGWNDIGYNALVDKYGVLYEGRAGGVERSVVGAQAQGYNSQTTGIASIGDHTKQPLSDPALDAVGRFLGWKLSIHGVPGKGTVTVISQGGRSNRYPPGARVELARISGHRDVDSTACPGKLLYGQLETLRSQVRTGSIRIPLVSFAADPLVLDYPEQAALTGRVLGSDTGQPLVNTEVAIEVLGRRGWRTWSRSFTQGDGSFETSAGPASHRTFRARVAAVGGYRVGLSSTRRLLVRASVRSRFSSLSRFEQGGEAILVGDVRPRKPRLVMAVLRRNRRGRFVRVARIPIRVRAGRYRAAYRFRKTGVYRFRVVFKRDRRNASARAADLTRRVEADSGGLGSHDGAAGGQAPAGGAPEPRLPIELPG